MQELAWLAMHGHRSESRHPVSARGDAAGRGRGLLPELVVAVSSSLPYPSPGLLCFAGRRNRVLAGLTVGRLERLEQQPSEGQRCRLGALASSPCSRHVPLWLGPSWSKW